MEYACLNNTVTRMLSAAFAGRGRLAVLPQHGAAINKATATARTAASRRRYWQPSLAASSIKSRPQAFCQLAQVRAYATHKDTPNKPSAHRRQITLTQDDGRVRWAELSPREKFTRGTQQSLNFSMVVVGAILTGTVFTLLYQEVFAPDSKTWQFNRVVNRIKQDPRCQELLGEGKQISAYGDNSWSKWVRNRPVATSIKKDQLGRENMKMRFYVSGPRNDGIVTAHLVKDLETKEYGYELLVLDVKGHTRLCLEDAQAARSMAARAATKIFGIRWS